MTTVVGILWYLSVAMFVPSSINARCVANWVNAFDPQVDFQEGISVVLYGNDSHMEINTRGFFEDLERRKLGVNTIMFTFPIFMDDLTSLVVYQDEELTPSVVNIKIFIEEGHRYCYTVIPKPIIDDGRLGGWRGRIRPGNNLDDQTALDAWFASYGELIMKYAQVSQSAGAGGLVIGTELISIDKDLPKYNQRWEALIERVRTVYTGPVSYSMNWNPQTLPGFVSSLDVLMVDAYFPLSNLGDDASEEQIFNAWYHWHGLLQSWQEMLDMPIVFSEVGMPPRTGGYRAPWENDPQLKVDFEAQARYYAATCRYVRASGVDGLYWWAVGFYDHMQNQYQRYLDDGIITHNFYDLPAEEALRQCYMG
ncbi:MAG: hypothetical protein M3Q81_01535 [bacterium]|nr:hypothetical protein [bacterium]